MLTNNDKQFISELFIRNNEVLVKEVLELFEVTNSRIDELGEEVNNMGKKLDQTLNELSQDHRQIQNHEGRIGKLEDKILSN